MDVLTLLAYFLHIVPILTIQVPLTRNSIKPLYEPENAVAQPFEAAVGAKGLPDGKVIVGIIALRGGRKLKTKPVITSGDQPCIVIGQ